MRNSSILNDIAIMATENMSKEDLLEFTIQNLNEMDADEFAEVLDRVDPYIKASITSSTMDDLVDRVLLWADNKGIIASGTPMRQIIKSLEEVHEAIEATYNDDMDEMVDSCGDAMVTLIIYSALIGKAPSQCLEAALDVIENRTGKMINNTFVKDS